MNRVIKLCGALWAPIPGGFDWVVSYSHNALGKTVACGGDFRPYYKSMKWRTEIDFEQILRCILGKGDMQDMCSSITGVSISQENINKIQISFRNLQ